MKFINNMSIKIRLLLMVIPPLLIIIFNSVLAMNDIFSQKKNLQASRNSILEAQSLSEVVHYLQIERGMSVGFTTSNGVNNKDNIPGIRKQVGYALDGVKSTYASTQSDASVLNALSQLEQKRNSIDSLTLSPADTGAYYTKVISELLDASLKIPTIMGDKESRNVIQAYLHLASAKEALGQTRAFLNGAFINNGFTEDNLVKFTRAMGAYRINTHKFTVLAPDELKKFYDNTFSGDAVEKTFAMIAIGEKNGLKGNFGVEPSVWFPTVTASIELLKTVEDELYKNTYIMADKKIENLSMKFNMSLALVIFFIGAGIVVSIFLTKNIVNPLNAIQQGLTSFFSFLNRETTKAELINLDSQDEFGQMARIINENIRKIEIDIITDAKFIEDVQSVMNRVQNGWFSQHIEANSDNVGLQNLKITVNHALNNLRANFIVMNGILEEYCNYNYTKELTISNVEKNGVFDTLLNDINKLRDAITTMLTTSLTNGIDLQSDASNLKQAVEALSTASNEQAASLEETAAAMEEMTSNVQNNAHKSNDMAIMAKETDKAAKEGAALAQRTASAMTEIQAATNSINDAVAIIENIAFQTNILSLNAAVEAATAGDAGKGFAVVAQEVRNLANRSADAAKEIKAMAVRAAEKSNEGMNISTELTKGFEVIASKIEQTTMLVQDVSNASKEQMQGIGQINTAITQLDQMTQENAKVAAQADSIANATIDKAEAMVEDAQSKEFVGKSNIIATQTTQRTNKPVQAAKPVVVSKNSYSSKALPKKGSSHDNGDTWESF